MVEVRFAVVEPAEVLDPPAALLADAGLHLQEEEDVVDGEAIGH